MRHGFFLILFLLVTLVATWAGGPAIPPSVVVSGGTTITADTATITVALGTTTAALTTIVGDIATIAGALATTSSHVADSSDPHGTDLTQTNASMTRLDVSGFTMLGDSSPKIKMKKLTGTTPSEVGSTTTILSGIADRAKIVGIQALVDTGANMILPTSEETTIYYHAYAQNGNFIVQLGGGATGILSKNFVAIITYEE